MPIAKPKGSEAGGKMGVAGENIPTTKVPPTPHKIYGGGK